MTLDCCHHLMAKDFVTWHDHTFSIIMANEMLMDYIQGELGKLEHPEFDGNSSPKSPMNWTGKMFELVQNLYA